MPDYDQRWIRRAGQGFRTASIKHPICLACGDAPRCALPRAQVGDQCGVFLPVLSFKGMEGLNATFNTFRKGLGWYRRLAVGSRVRLFANEHEEFVGEGRVIETHQGMLGPLLGRHAAMNHLMRDGAREKADARLAQELVRLYGRNHAAPDMIYSVIYIECSDGDR